MFSDSTKKHTAAHQSFENYTLFKDLFDNLNDSVFVVDPATSRIVDVNLSACQKLAYSKEELLKLRVIDIDKNFQSVTDYQKRVDNLRKGSSNLETEQIRKDGTTFPVEINSRLVKHNGHEYVVGIARDISARITTEKKLKQLFEVVEQSPTSILITDVNGHIEYVNPYFSEITGYKSSEVIGKKPNILKSGEQSKDFYRNMWQTIKQGRIWRGEFHNKKKNGELFWESATIAPISDENNNIISFFAIKEDITEKKLAVEKLRESEEKYRMVANFTSDWEYWIDQNKKYVFISPSCLQISGYEPENFINNPDLLFKIIYPDDRIKFKKYFNSMFKDRKPSATEFRIITKNGIEKWLGHNSQPVFNDDGQWAGIRGSYRDITPRILAEKKSQKAETLKSIQELSGAISHEFSQPLQALDNYLDLLKKFPDKHQYLDKSASNVKRIKELVDNLRDLTSIQRQDYLSTQIIDIKQSTSGEEARILVVDDESSILDTMVEMIQMTGYPCDGAQNGLEALKLMNQNKYRIIFSDISMPGMSGTVLFEKIKAIEYDCYFIFMTGYALSGEMEKIVKKAYALINKPVSFSKILELIENLIGKPKITPD